MAILPISLPLIRRPMKGGLGGRRGRGATAAATRGKRPRASLSPDDLERRVVEPRTHAGQAHDRFSRQGARSEWPAGLRKWEDPQAIEEMEVMRRIVIKKASSGKSCFAGSGCFQFPKLKLKMCSTEENEPGSCPFNPCHFAHDHFELEYFRATQDCSNLACADGPLRTCSSLHPGQPHPREIALEYVSRRSRLREKQVARGSERRKEQEVMQQKERERNLVSQSARERGREMEMNDDCDRNRKYNRDSSNDRDLNYERGRDYDIDQSYGRHRGYDHDRSFDRDRSLDRNRSSDGDRGYDGDRSHDGDRSLDRDHSYDLGRSHDLDRSEAPGRGHGRNSADKVNLDRDRGRDEGRGREGAYARQQGGCTGWNREGEGDRSHPERLRSRGENGAKETMGEQSRQNTILESSSTEVKDSTISEQRRNVVSHETATKAVALPEVPPPPCPVAAVPDREPMSTAAWLRYGRNARAAGIADKFAFEVVRALLLDPQIGVRTSDASALSGVIDRALLPPRDGSGYPVLSISAAGYDEDSFSLGISPSEVRSDERDGFDRCCAAVQEHVRNVMCERPK